MWIAQISDLHLTAGRALLSGMIPTADMLEAAVRQLNALDPRPAALIATGDLVDSGSPEQYGLLREILAPLAMPVYLLAGNHDDRRNLIEAFPGMPWLRSGEPFIQYAVDDLPFRILALDSSEPGRSGGVLCDRRLAWLDRELQREARPTLIALHHPPFSCGIAHLDRCRLANPESLASVLMRCGHVSRVTCGHVHRAMMRRFANTVASSCPSTAHQIGLTLDPEHRGALAMEPPGFQLHGLLDGEIVTHGVPIGDFGTPYQFGC